VVGQHGDGGQRVAQHGGAGGHGLDLAIDGNGFFMVANPNTTARSYTRAAQFSHLKVRMKLLFKMPRRR
jgi:flagellar basal body rod protein FlgF